MGILVISAVCGAFGPPKPQPAPAWIGVAAGLVFIAGGSIAILHWLSGGLDGKAGPLWLRLSLFASMLTITGGLALTRFGLRSARARARSARAALLS